MDETIEQVADLLKKSKIRYMITGGQAVLRYGEPRFTKDIDVTIAVDVTNYAQVIRLFEKKFDILSKNEEFSLKTWVLPLQHKKTKVFIDIVFSQTGFESDAIKSGKKFKIGKTSVNFISPEYLIAQKIFAGRPIDIQDAKHIAFIQGNKLDLNLILRLIKSLDELLNQNDFSNRWKLILDEMNK